MLNFEISLLKITLDQLCEIYLEIKTESGKFFINLLSSIIFLFSNSMYLFFILFLFCEISKSALIFASKKPLANYVSQIIISERNNCDLIFEYVVSE